ncbi:MAG: TlyA family RNA methyltransferase [Clostridia bacterium]|nr:TlyA family RNA methyltransferase [Clostridia bacterium]
MRADKYFADRFGSRTKAAEAIEKGLVLVNGKSVRPKDEIKETDEITFVRAEEYFVSNGGYKLARAVKNFAIDCKNKIFVDIGASTGGFTDCLLQNGAAKVYAVDVGESLLHESLLTNDKIVRMENTNARYLTKEDFSDAIDGIVTDVSFISLRLIFPVIKAVLSDRGFGIVLVKPQFECEKKHIGKSGIVAPSAHSSIVKKILAYASENGLYPFGIVNAPVRKGKNIEYVLYLKGTPKDKLSDQQIIEEVKALVTKYAAGELT